MMNNWIFSWVAFVAGGDVLALLLFSAIGRFSHGFVVFDLETLNTADPFMAGMLFFLLLSCCSLYHTYLFNWNLELRILICLALW